MTGNMEQHVPVFVSSTYADLEPHRAEVQHRLVGLEQVVKGMEYFGSSPDTPLDTCLKNISDCKLFILLVGASYGSIHPELEKSFTELEYDYAIQKKIPVLVYMADMNSTTVGIPPAGVDTKHVAELDSFKERLKKTHTISTFTSIDDLGKKVEHDIPEMLRRLDDTISIAAEKTELSEKVDEDMLREGAVKFEKFWLLPRRYGGEIVPLRLRISSRWNGQQLIAGLVEGAGLEVGDTISASVTVELTRGILNSGRIELLAGGDDADWLIDHNVKSGSIIECYVRFVYYRAPSVLNGKIINQMALVFVREIEL